MPLRGTARATVPTTVLVSLYCARVSFLFSSFQTNLCVSTALDICTIFSAGIPYATRSVLVYSLGEKMTSAKLYAYAKYFFIIGETIALKRKTPRMSSAVTCDQIITFLFCLRAFFIKYRDHNHGVLICKMSHESSQASTYSTSIRS